MVVYSPFFGIDPLFPTPVGKPFLKMLHWDADGHKG